MLRESIYRHRNIPHRVGYFFFFEEGMESIISIDNLNLTNELKNILLSNQIYTVYEFFEKGISVFKKYFLLTCEDWKSIINVFVSIFPGKRCNNPVIASIANEYHKKNNPFVDAIIINFFDEKYVVHVKKKSKWLHDDYIYKAIFNGIVFYSYDEAKKFAELICEKNKSKLIEREIKSAQNNIYVIKAFLREKGKCVIYCDTVVDNEIIIKVINESTDEGLVKPLRANKLLREMVEKINCIYDYDIAKIVIADFDGENLSILDSGTELYEEIDNDSSDKVLVDVKKYRLELRKNIDNESTEYFNWGKNEALCEAAFWSIKFIKNKLMIVHVLAGLGCYEIREEVFVQCVAITESVVDVVKEIACCGVVEKGVIHSQLARCHAIKQRFVTLGVICVDYGVNNNSFVWAG